MQRTKINSSLRYMPAIGFIVLAVGYYTLTGNIGELNEVIRIPVIDDALIFLLYGTFLLVNRTIDLFRKPVTTSEAATD